MVPVVGVHVHVVIVVHEDMGVVHEDMVAHVLERAPRCIVTAPRGASMYWPPARCAAAPSYPFGFKVMPARVSFGPVASQTGTRRRRGTGCKRAHSLAIFVYCIVFESGVHSSLAIARK